MSHKVFIDGEAGTTGLLIRERLLKRTDISLLSLAADVRKDVSARKEMINSADVVILCLPDAASHDAVKLCENPDTVIIDASTQHRIDPEWVYGFPELGDTQRANIKASKRISNPGCYATAFIALMHPLVSSGVIAPYFPISCHGVSGYSGGGREMITQFQGANPDPYRIYATGLNHKHLPEMTVYSGLETPPIFTPAVGNYFQGMILEIPLPLWALDGDPDIADIHQTLANFYKGQPFIQVQSLEVAEATPALCANSLANSNLLKIYVFGHVETAQARLVAVLDNLGKGASGAMVQNLNIVLGLDETIGLLPHDDLRNGTLEGLPGHYNYEKN